MDEGFGRRASRLFPLVGPVLYSRDLPAADLCHQNFGASRPRHVEYTCWNAGLCPYSLSLSLSLSLSYVPEGEGQSGANKTGWLYRSACCCCCCWPVAKGHRPGLTLVSLRGPAAAAVTFGQVNRNLFGIYGPPPLSLRLSKGCPNLCLKPRYGSMLSSHPRRSCCVLEAIVDHALTHLSNLVTVGCIQLGDPTEHVPPNGQVHT